VGVPDKQTTSPRGGRRWGGEVALLNEAQARARLLDAAGRCIVRTGSAQIRMADVATEAEVSRSTLYRYFPTRGDLIVGLFLTKVDKALASIVTGLAEPDRAAMSLPDLVLKPLTFIEGSAVNEVLFSPENLDLVASLELRSDQLHEARYRHFGPLLQRWQADGQLQPDLSVRDVVRWLETVSLIVLSPPWRDRSPAQLHDFVVRHVVRALITPQFG
jgi:TetR/AcrR family transcriptional regulator